jgi:hypothetical protein
MSKERIDGFQLNAGNPESCRSERFFTANATNSFNTGYKYILIVVTDDKDYARNVLKCNARHKVYQIPTKDYDINRSLYGEAIMELLEESKQLLKKKYLKLAHNVNL